HGCSWATLSSASCRPNRVASARARVVLPVPTMPATPRRILQSGAFSARPHLPTRYELGNGQLVGGGVVAGLQLVERRLRRAVDHVPLVVEPRPVAGASHLVAYRVNGRVAPLMCADR